MKIICAFITSSLALTASCLLNGCARDHLKAATYQPIEPTHWAPGTQVTGASTNSPLSYQWFSTNGGYPSSTFSATAGGNGSSHYGWQVNTNGHEGTPSTVQVTNGALFYQWYKNTNTN